MIAYTGKGKTGAFVMIADRLKRGTPCSECLFFFEAKMGKPEVPLTILSDVPYENGTGYAIRRITEHGALYYVFGQKEKWSPAFTLASVTARSNASKAYREIQEEGKLELFQVLLQPVVLIDNQAGEFND